MTTLAGLTRTVAELGTAAGHPVVVGVSGFGGSGTSSLAARLAKVLPGAVQVRGDDLLDPARSHRRSSEWSGVECVPVVRLAQIDRVSRRVQNVGLAESVLESGSVDLHAT